MAKTEKFWLLKTEPESFSIHDLAKAPKQTTFWDGVRNYQARNYLREMSVGDRLLFYHSSTKPQAIVGTARVMREAYPDHTAWDESNHHYDPASTPDNPRWFMVDIKLDEIFDQPLTLESLRGVAKLKGMELLRKGSRLSVQPVSKVQFDTILKLASAAARQ